MIERNRTCHTFLSAVLFSLAVLLTGCSSSHPSAGVINITSGTGALNAGASMQLRAVDTNFVGTPKDVTSTAIWTSSNIVVGTVNSTGLFTSLTAGTTVVTATSGQDSGSLSITVGAPLISAISLTPGGVSVPAGLTQQYTATASYANNTSANVSTTSQWSVAPASVATISATGLLTSVAPGTYTITVSAGSGSNLVSNTITGTVVVPVLSSLVITPATPSIAGGAQQQFKATGTYSDKTTADLSSSVTWTSSNTAVLTITSAGLATAAPSGANSAVQLSATSGTITTTTAVTITPGAYVTNLVVTPTSSSIASGTAEQHKATAWYSDGTRKDVTAGVTWTSSTPGVTTVSASGVNTAVTPGVSTLQATLPVASASSTTVQASSVVLVTAATPTALNIVSTHPLFPVNTTQPLQLIGTFSDGTTQDLSLTANWQTSDVNIATVDAAGIATGVGAGPIVFSASFGGLTDSTQGFQVTATGLVSTAINAIYPTPVAGTCQQLSLVGTYADGTTHDLTALASWSTSDGTVLTVDATGYACAVQSHISSPASRNAQVTATVGTYSSSIALTSVADSAVSVAVYPQPAKFALGTTLPLTALTTMQSGSTLDLTTNAIWSSANPNIITVDAAGRAKSGKTGTTVVTATTLGVTGTSAPIQITSATIIKLVLQPASSSIAAGTAQRYKAVGYFSDGTTQDLNRDVTWDTADNTVASVDVSGLALGLKPGTTQVIASFNGQSATVPLTVTNATLVSTTLTPSNIELPLGTRRTFTLTGNFTDGTTQDLSYDAVFSTPTPSIISFTGPGQALGAKAGIGQVTAQRGYFNSSTPVTVPNVALSTLAVTPADSTVRLTDSKLITATGTFADGFSMNLVDNALFNSSAPQIATVQLNGQTSAVGIGTTTISAAFRGVTASTNSFTVLSNVLSSLSLSPANPTITAGNTQQITASGTYADGTTSDISSLVIWTSSNPALLTVSSTGLATAFSTPTAATATLTATYGSTTAYLAATIQPAGAPGAALSSITVTPTSSHIPAGGTQQLTATGVYADGTYKDITSTVVWTSTLPATAIVNNLGLVTAVAPGLVSIQASVGSIRSSAIINVTAAALQSIVITPTSASLTTGGTQQFTATGIYSNQTQADITSQVIWSSSSAAQLTINSAGLAVVPSGATSGLVTITAISGPISATANVQVTTTTSLTSLVVVPTSSSIAPGSAEQHTAIATYSDGTKRDVTNQVNWSASSSSTVISNAVHAHDFTPNASTNTVVTVDPTGVDTAMSPGTTQVQATLNGVQSQSVVIVTPATVTSLSVTSTKSLFPAGAIQPVKLIGRFSDGTTQDLTLTANWQSSAPAIATIDVQGNATGVNSGTVQFTASFGGLTTTSQNFTVLPATLLYGTLKTALPGSVKGTSLPYHFIGTYSDGSTHDLSSITTWSSSDPTVLTIDSNGLSYSVELGTADVTGTVLGRSASASHAVVDTSLLSIAVKPSSPSFALGTTNLFTAIGTYGDGAVSSINAFGTIFTSSDPSVFTIDATGRAKAGRVGNATVTASLNGVIGTSVSVQVTAASLWRLRVSPNTAQIAAGVTEEYQAIGYFLDGTVQDVTTDVKWTSEDTTIARIDERGSALGVLPGATQIVGTFGNQTARYPITVTSATLKAANIIPGNTELPIGLGRQFSFIGTYSDGTTHELTDQAIWSSTTPGIATVLDGGSVFGVGIGVGTVTAQFGFFGDSTPVTVTNAAATALTLTPAITTLRIGDQQKMIATATFSDGFTQDVGFVSSFTSSNPTVATVLGSGDTPYALAVGSTRIDATFRNFTASTTSFRVFSNVITSIAITPPNPSLTAGSQQQFTATATYADGSTADISKSVVWTSSNLGVLNLDSNGLATAFNTPGTVSVTVAAASGGASASFNVMVLPAGTPVMLDSIAITPAGGSLTAKSTSQLTATGSYSDGTFKDLTTSVTWSSSDSTLLAVNAAGLATVPAHTSGGVATITAQSGTVVATTTVQITTSAVITALVIEPTSSSIATGSAEQHTATAWYSDGTQRDVTNSVVWSAATTSISSNVRTNTRSASASPRDASGSDVVAVNQTGFTTAGTPGQAMLQASISSLQASSVVIVTPATVTSLSIRATRSLFPVGSTQPLQLIGTFSDGSSQDLSLTAHWQSSSSAVATVDSTGLATGVSAGNVTFTGSFGGLSASTVGYQVLPAGLVSVAIDVDYSIVIVGPQEQFRLIGNYADGSTQDLTVLAAWQSSNPDAFPIDPKSGIGYGLAPGAAQINGSFGGLTASINVASVPAKLLSIDIQPNAQSIAHGTTQQFTAVGNFDTGSAVDITKAVVWASNDPTTLTINAVGRAKSGNPGSTQVTASLLGVTGTSGAVSVSTATLSRLAIQAASTTLAALTGQPYTATGTFADGTFQDLTADVSWNTANNTLASIDAVGFGTALSPGQTTVTATFAGHVATMPLAITAATLTGVVITPGNSKLPVAVARQYSLIGTFSDNTTQDLSQAAIWNAPQSSIAAVTFKGKVLGISAGVGTVSAQLGYFSASAPVQVTNATLTSLTLSPTSATIRKGTIQPFTVTGTFSDGFTMDMALNTVFHTSASGIASIVRNGQVGGVSVGSAQISATFRNQAATTTSFIVLSDVINSISLAPASPSVTAGGSQQLTATALYADGSTADISSTVVWTSSNPALLTVSSTGVATALPGASGTATVTATSGDTTASFTVAVLPAQIGAPTLTLINVTPTSSRIAYGTTQQLTATGVYSDGSVKNLTSQVAWTSSNPSSATVNASGLVSGFAAGTITVQASFGSSTGNAVVLITSATLNSIAISPSGASFAAGFNQQFVLTGTFSDGTTQNLSTAATWSSSNATVASISPTGLAAGLAPGSVQFTATYNGRTVTSGTATVTPATLVSVSVTPANASFAKGTSQQFTITGTFTDGTTRDLTSSATFTSSNPGVLDVSSTGLASGVLPGTAQLTISVGGQTITTPPVTVTAATLVSVAINPMNPSLAFGTSQQFTAIGTFSDGTTEVLTNQAVWTSSNPSVLTIDQYGNASTTAVGSVQVSATVNGITVSTGTVQVTPASLASLTISPTSIQIAKGTTQQFTVIGTFTDGTTQNLTSQVTWTSSDGTVVGVSSTGLANGTGVGTAQITASYNGKSVSTTPIQVSPATLLSIAFNPANPSVAVGTTGQVAVVGTFSDGTTQDLTSGATFSSSNTGVATVSGGVLTGVAPGSAIITVTANGQTGSFSVGVSNAILSSIAITPANPLPFAKGTTQQFTAIGTFSDGTTQNLTSAVNWSSSSTSVFTVDQNGLATGTGVGVATLSASSQGQTAVTSAVQVTAPTIASIAVTPATISLASGLTQQFTATATYTDSSTQDASNAVTWTSSNTGVATVSSVGVVTGIATGNATIQAQLGALTSQASVSVSTPTLQSITVTPATPSIVNGTTQQFIATGLNSDGTTQNLTGQVTWTSSAPATATINSSGLATSTGSGATTIKAALGPLSASTSLTVTTAPLQSITITPASPSIVRGTTQQFTATGMYTDGSTQNLTTQVTWTSSNPAFATVNSIGVATGVATGTTTIKAQSGSISGTTALIVQPPPVTLQSIAVTPASATVTKGASQQFTATGTYSDNSVQDLTTQVAWSSSSTNATVSTSGLATGKLTGTAQIQASLFGKAATANLTITPAILNSIVVTPATATIADGTTQQYAAVGMYSDGSTQTLTTQVTWSSSVTALATINANGLATAVATGSPTITAASGTVTSNTATLTITSATPTSIQITPSPITNLPAGDMQQLLVTATFTDGTSQNVTTSVAYASSNAAVTTVTAAGVLNAVAPGSAIVTATLGSLNATDSVTVSNAVLRTIIITPANPSIAAGLTQQLTATGKYTDGSTQDLTNVANWSSSATTTTVNTTGLVSVASPGVATITATYNGISGSDTVTGTAATVTAISVTPASVTLAAGQTQQFTATGTFTDGGQQNITSTIHWSVSDATRATISSSGNTAGLLTSTAAGTTNAIATMGSISGSASVTITSATLTGLTINPAALSGIAAGTTKQLSVTGAYSDGSNADVTTLVTWSSSSASTVYVDNTGLLHAVASGIAIINATLQGVTGTAVVNVSNATLTSVAITPANPILALGQTAQLTATGTYSDGSTQDITTQVQWNSSASTVATVSSTGLLTSLRTGGSTISATRTGVTGQTTLNVTSAILQSISVQAPQTSFALGQTLQLQAIGVYSDGTTQNLTTSVTWTSGTPTVGVVNSAGLATGVRPGIFNAVATLGSVSGSLSLTVTSATLVSIAVTPTNQIILNIQGSKVQFTATGTFSDGSTQILTNSVHWSTTGIVVGTISQAGVFSPTGIGLGTVVATSGALSGSTQLTVVSLPIL